MKFGIKLIFLHADKQSFLQGGTTIFGGCEFLKRNYLIKN